MNITKKSILSAAILLASIVGGTLVMAANTSCQAKANRQAAATVENTTTPEGSAAVNDNYNIKTIAPDVSGDKIIETIKKEYAGKVVLVDVWATWCPPCRAAMKTIDEIKPELQKKGVVFVYLTGETSPESKWKEMIPNIAGDHYRLTDKQWREMGNSLNMRGIPAYMIIGKDGKEAYSNITEGGYPGNDIIQNGLEAALSK